MKSKNKVILLIVSTVITISLVFGVIIYFNSKEEVITVSKSANETQTVTLTENNCSIEKEKYKATIKKYNGNAESIVIDASSIESINVEIKKDAFAECGNLETILIEKTLVNEDLEIESFEKDETYKDSQYVQYKNTRPYSEAYTQYLSLSEEKKKESEIIPAKYDIPISALYTESMEKNYKISTLEEEELPTSFDLRDHIEIKVEDQKSTGTCYSQYGNTQSFRRKFYSQWQRLRSARQYCKRSSGTIRRQSGIELLNN